MGHALTPEMQERLARAIHERYRRNQEGRKPPDDEAMADWDDLAEHLRESNRKQAAQTFVKLEAIGCTALPAGAGWDGVVAFTGEELGRLAELEHERWVAERLADGWTLGERDIQKKTSPHLVSWEELPEKVRERDREAVRAIPELLANVGLEIWRST